MSLKAKRKEKQEEETDLSALDRFLPLQVSALLSPLDKCRIAPSHFPIIAYGDWANNNSSLPVKIISLSYVALGSSSRPLHRFFIPFVKFVWRIKAHFAKASWRLLCGQANNFFFRAGSSYYPDNGGQFARWNWSKLWMPDWVCHITGRCADDNQMNSGDIFPVWGRDEFHVTFR